MSFVGLTLGILGVWRVTHLLHAEDGPWEMSAKVRRWLAARGVGRAIECFDCCSLWVAAPFALVVATTWLERALAWPALSAGAMVLNRIAFRQAQRAVATYIEDPPEEVSDVPMRTDATRHSSH
jgi:hypothetical protein